MISPLKESSRSYERSANAVEKVLRDHALAIACWDVEELIEVGLALFSSYERLDSRWRSGVRRGDENYPIEHGLELREIAATLAQGRAVVLQLIRVLESAGYVLEGATQFRSLSFLPFDERPFEVHFGDDQLQSLAALGPKAPESGEE